MLQEYIQEHFDGNYENLIRSLKELGNKSHVSVDALISELDDRYDSEIYLVNRMKGETQNVNRNL